MPDSAKIYGFSAATGDLVLELSENSDTLEKEARRFLVNSQILMELSRYFRTMLAEDSPFLERKTLVTGRVSKKPPTLKLYDDDPDTMALILKILHLKTNDIPRTLQFDQMLQLATIADKYELVEPLQMWVEIWSKDPSLSFDEMLLPEFTDWIFVCVFFKLSYRQKYASELIKISYLEYFNSSTSERERRQRLFFTHPSQRPNGYGVPDRYRLSEDIPSSIIGRCLPLHTGTESCVGALTDDFQKIWSQREYCTQNG